MPSEARRSRIRHDVARWTCACLLSRAGPWAPLLIARLYVDPGAAALVLLDVAVALLFEM
eukprot:4198002-Pyramimonas_sp.AAC.1